MSLAKWQEVAGSNSKSGASLELKAGLSWAADLGVLEFNGAEAAKFLQGYLTCDTQALPEGLWQPTALCNLKGRVVVNGWVSADAQGSLWLLVHRTLVETCLAFLHKYLVFAKAEGHNRSDALVAILGVEQAKPDNLNAQAFVAGQLTNTWLGLATPDQAIELWTLHKSQVTDSSQCNIALLKAGLALVDHHSSEQYLPQMLGLTYSGAINFDKGCYLGQEIVARAQHRGAVKRQLARLTWQDSAQDAEQNMAAANGRWDAADLLGDNNANLGKIINWLEASDGSGTLFGKALAVVSSKEGNLPTRAQAARTAQSAATEFQVSKIEN